MSANLGTNICLRSKQALPGSDINRIIKQTVMSRITANYDKICFGICLRGSRVLKSAQEFISAVREQAPEYTDRDSLGYGCEACTLCVFMGMRVGEGCDKRKEAQQNL